MPCGGGCLSMPRAAAPRAMVEVSLLTGLVPLKLCQCLPVSGVVLGCFPTWQMVCGLGRSFSLRGKLKSSKVGGWSAALAPIYLQPDLLNSFSGTCLVIQWLRLHASNAAGMGSIPAQGTKISDAVQRCQKTKQKNPRNLQRWALGIYILAGPPGDSDVGLTLGSTVIEVGFSKLACVMNHLGTRAVTQLRVGPRSLHF